MRNTPQRRRRTWQQWRRMGGFLWQQVLTRVCTRPPPSGRSRACNTCDRPTAWLRARTVPAALAASSRGGLCAALGRRATSRESSRSAFGALVQTWLREVCCCAFVRLRSLTSLREQELCFSVVLTRVVCTRALGRCVYSRHSGGRQGRPRGRLVALDGSPGPPKCVCFLSPESTQIWPCQICHGRLVA